MAKVEVKIILLHSCISNRQIICYSCDKLCRKTVLPGRSIGGQIAVDIGGNCKQFLTISLGLCPNYHELMRI